MAKLARQTMTSHGKYYDTYWGPSGFRPRSSGLDPIVRELIASRVGPGKACLDFGCGDGHTYGQWLSSITGSYIGFDVSKSAVAEAQRLGLAAHRLDGVELPLEDDTVDVVVCLEVLEHLFLPAQTANELVRVLSPGGVLIATVPNIAYWRRRIDSIAGRWNPFGDDRSVAEPWRDPHIRFFTLRTLHRMLAAVGFVRINVWGHGGALLREVPYLRRHARARPSLLYGAWQRRFPAIAATRLCAVAHKPLEDKGTDPSA